MIRLLLIALLFEVGIVLVVAPWSTYWDRNFFADAIPGLHALITNNFFRGAVSGIGVVNLLACAAEIVSLVFARRTHDPVISLRATQVEEQRPTT